MRYIMFPSPIQLVTLKGDPIKSDKGEPVEVTMADFLFGLGTVLAGRLVDPAFKGMKGALAVQEIREQWKEACERVVTPAYLAIGDEPWRLLKQATETPGAETDYWPAISFNLTPFFRAVADATDKRPAAQQQQLVGEA